MSVRRILSLDLATRIGFAFGTIGAEPEFGAHLLPSTGPDLGAYLEAFDEWLGGESDLAAFGYPELVVFECPILPKFTNLMTVRKLNALPAFLEWRCRAMKIPVREVSAGKCKKFWTGHGNAKKPDMTAAARRWGYASIEDKKNEDEADALAGYWYTVSVIAPQHATRFALGSLGAGSK